MLQYWLWLTTREGLSKRSVLRVLEHFGDPRQAMLADRTEYRLIAGLTQNEISALEDKNLAEPQHILDACYNKGIHLLTYADAGYPQRLKALEDAPAVLYWLGRLPDFDALPLIAVVGTRKATAYGLQTAKRMGYQLGRSGGVVVSGLAKGIDGLAMEGCLSADSMAVGVLGGGVDVVYPRENSALFRDVEDRGCLVSEYPPGTQALGAHFPVRNRIISGLSLGVVVVEAPEKSGALITARYALEQGRDVFAIPGTIDTAAFAGSNGLIQQGAKLVTSGWDVLSEYEHLFPDRLKPEAAAGITKLSQKQLRLSQDRDDGAENGPKEAENPEKQPKPAVMADQKGIDNPDDKPYHDLETQISQLSADERAIVFQLLAGPMQVDDLAQAAELTAAQVLAAMTMLQIRGLVTSGPGKILELTTN